MRRDLSRRSTCLDRGRGWGLGRNLWQELCPNLRRQPNLENARNLRIDTSIGYGRSPSLRRGLCQGKGLNSGRGISQVRCFKF